MADDDDTIDPEDEVLDPEAEEADPEIDPDDLNEEELEADDEFAGGDDEFADTDTADADAEDEDADDDTDGPVRRAVSNDDEDDDDIVAPDDVEADLDTILKDRLVATEEGDDDEEPEDRSESADRLQPKRSDERLCPRCFLLVRKGAPTCPIGDDDCPLMAKPKKK